MQIKIYKLAIILFILATGGYVLLLIILKKNKNKPKEGISTHNYNMNCMKSELLDYGPPSNCSFLIKEAYLNCYNNERHIPIWTYEKLNNENFNGGKSREECHFRDDPDVEKNFSSSRLSFLNSGYDRGHMAPSSHHQNSLSAMCSTFYYSNVVPQNKKLNNGLWNRIEKFIETKTINSKSYAHVVTGPLFIPSKSGSGEKQRIQIQYELLNGNVAIPTHLFKVVMFEGDDNKFSSYSFLVNNSEDHSQHIDDCLVDMNVIENAGGLKFFPAIHRDLINQRTKIN